MLVGNIALVIQSHAFEKRMLRRPQMLPDTNLGLRTRRFRSKRVHIFGVAKDKIIDVHTDGTVHFQVEPGTGMRVMPMSGAKP